MIWLASYWVFVRPKHPAFGAGMTVGYIRTPFATRSRTMTSTTYEAGQWWVGIGTDAVMLVAGKDSRC